MSFQFHLDQPAAWDQLSRCLIVRGWCFGPQPDSVRGIRLRAGDVILSGALGFPRPDVRAALPAAPSDSTGFEIRGILPAGRIRVVLEAELADGSRPVLLDRVVRVRRPWLPLWAGGGDWMELMFFQMPGHMAHPPRPVAAERFPAPVARARWPHFSIVTPSFQQARFLRQTMHSVLDAGGVAVDYVVQDGGSRDGSAELIAAEAARPTPARPGPRLVAWASAPDGGQADAIARGFARTQGGPDDVMAWINSDDFYLPGALAHVADTFARHPEIDLLYGHRIVVDEDSREVARWFLPPHDPAVLRLNDFVPQETLFWRRRIWDRAGGIDPSFRFAMDWDFLLRADAAGARIVRIPWFLACFRTHAAQKTTAQLHSIGQAEITRLRERTHGRAFPAHEIEHHPRLMRYLRHSAWLEFQWRHLGRRAP